MTRLLAIDPGLSTGIVSGFYSDTEPFTVEGIYQPEGGAQGFLEWSKRNSDYDVYREDVVVVEKFVLSSGNEFVADLSGVPSEGIAMAFSHDPVVWQYRSQKSTVPDRVLKENDLWSSGADVGCQDARDANDAMIHALIYLRTIGHKPTLEKIYGGKA